MDHVTLPPAALQPAACSLQQAALQPCSLADCNGMPLTPPLRTLGLLPPHASPGPPAVGSAAGAGGQEVAEGLCRARIHVVLQKREGPQVSLP
jgi:hypothetical protein